jgi:UDP-GlcNAc:undecaprenyl-phosphate GlcNAc-1-phosphate transferase
LQVVGFIDDDVLKVGKRIQGFPIIGTLKDINKLISKYEISSLLISFAHNDPDRLKALKKTCLENKLHLKQFTIRVADVDLQI